MEYLGVQENGTIVAGALFETHRSRLSTFSVVHDGPLCDYRDRELTEYFMTQLKQHAKAKGSAQMEIVPEMPYCLHDSRGGELPADQGGAPADDAVETLKNLGFMHDGFTIGYTAVPRWRYLKDLTGITDEKSLLKSYDKRTQWSVKRAASMGVHVRELGEDELQVFADIEQATAERRNFEYRGEAYFRKFKQAYGSKAHFMVAQIHIGEYIADMESKRDVLRKKVDTLQTKYDEHPTTKTERQLGKSPATLRRRKSVWLKRPSMPKTVTCFRRQHPYSWNTLVKRCICSQAVWKSTSRSTLPRSFSMMPCCICVWSVA